MSACPTSFKDFLQEIRLTEPMVADLKRGHALLRERLQGDKSLRQIILGDFLQGSYRRATAVRPKDGKRADVDVVVATNIDASRETPEQAMGRFLPFLEEHYKGKWELQDRSIGISLSYVDLDLVLTSAPSEAVQRAIRSDEIAGTAALDELSGSGELLLEGLWKSFRSEAWRDEPLMIPDRTRQKWQPTHPLAQIEWTWAKNRRCNRHYVNVVKAIKWWRRLNANPEYPKGYPVEHLVGAHCPDGITSIAEGVTVTLEGMRDSYASYVAAGRVPYLKDHGVEQNVLGRLSPADFAGFHALVTAAAGQARAAYDEQDLNESLRRWGELFGPKFPEPPDGDSGARTGGGSPAGGPAGGFTPRTKETTPGGGRFA